LIALSRQQNLLSSLAFVITILFKSAPTVEFYDYHAAICFIHLICSNVHFTAIQQIDVY